MGKDAELQSEIYNPLGTIDSPAQDEENRKLAQRRWMQSMMDNAGRSEKSEQDFLNEIRGDTQTGGLIDASAYDAVNTIDRNEVNAQIANAQQSRGEAISGVGRLRDQADRAGDISRMEANMHRARVGSEISGRAAAAPGGYNPAAQRGAMMAAGNAGVGIAQQAQLSAAKERLNANNAYAAAAQQLMGQDIGQERFGRQLLGNEAQANRGSQQQLQRDRIGLQTGQLASDAAVAVANAQADAAVTGAVAGGIATAGTGAITSKFWK